MITKIKRNTRKLAMGVNAIDKDIIRYHSGNILSAFWGWSRISYAFKWRFSTASRNTILKILEENYDLRKKDFDSSLALAKELTYKEELSHREFFDIQNRILLLKYLNFNPNKEPKDSYEHFWKAHDSGEITGDAVYIKILKLGDDLSCAINKVMRGEDIIFNDDIKPQLEINGKIPIEDFQCHMAGMITGTDKKHLFILMDECPPLGEIKYIEMRRTPKNISRIRISESFRKAMEKAEEFCKQEIEEMEYIEKFKK